MQSNSPGLIPIDPLTQSGISFQNQPEKYKQNIFRKACDWLEKKSKGKFNRVVIKRNGNLQFVADVYLVERENKPDLRYCMEYQWLVKIIKIRRICV